jgi:fucose permease
MLGLANSLVWAGIWPVALKNLGRFTKMGASMLIMALCGSAIFPLIYGYLADLYDVRSAYWILVPCYLYLVFYAFYGHLIKQWTPTFKKNRLSDPKLFTEVNYKDSKNNMLINK